MTSLFLALVVLLVLAAIWVLRFIAWGLTEHPTFRGSRWWMGPATVAVATLLLVAALPLRLRFELARGDFDEAASAMVATGAAGDPVALSTPASIGSYRIVDADQVGPNVIFYVSYGRDSGVSGFAYFPDGVEAKLVADSAGPHSFRSLGGGWYAFRLSPWR